MFNPDKIPLLDKIPQLDEILQPDKLDKMGKFSKEVAYRLCTISGAKKFRVGREIQFEYDCEALIKEFEEQ